MSPLVRIGRTTPTLLFLAVLSAGTLTDAFAQPWGNQMCGDGTNQTYLVELPAVDDSPGGGLVFPLATLEDDAILPPKGCDIYLLIISGIGRNRNFDELLFYPLAKYVAEHNGYVHYAWWNNLLQPYMSGPLHPIDQNDLLGLGSPLTANHHPGKRYSKTASLVAPILGFDEAEFEVAVAGEARQGNDFRFGEALDGDRVEADLVEADVLCGGDAGEDAVEAFAAGDFLEGGFVEGVEADVQSV